MIGLPSNHICTNIITKGWLNISAITKGMILPSFQYIIHKKRKGGGILAPEVLRDDRYLIDDLKKIKEQGEEVDYIEVFVNWNHQPFKWGKHVYAELVRKKIEAELITKLDEKYIIKVQLLDSDKK